jgi:hypothetical protein
MRKSAISIVLLYAATALYADDARVLPPQHPSPEEASTFGRLVTERRQRALIAELDEMAAADPQVTLYTINPRQDNDWEWEGKKQWVDVIRGYPILGKAEVSVPEDRQALLRALIQGIRESDGTVAACFEPRHALTIATKTRKVDIVVCFECMSGLAWGAYGGDDFLTTRSPLPVFGRIVSSLKLADPKR